MNTGGGKLKDLLRRIADHDDRNAFNRFFMLYHSKMIRFAMMFVSSYDTAEDVVSNVLTRFLEKRAKIFKMDKFEGYLYSSIKHEALRQNKLNNRFGHYHLSDNEGDFLSKETVGPYEVLVEKELSLLIYRTVEAMSPKRKMVYKLIKDDGLKYKEVADLLNISARTVEVHLKLAMKELKAQINNYLSCKSTGDFYLQIVKTLSIVVLATLWIVGQH